MSFWQNLYGSYNRVGNEVSPLYHMTLKTRIEITLDASGKLVSRNPIRKLDKEETIIIPCTEESQSHRSGTSPASHPLFDQIKHLQNPTYLKNLAKWCGRNPKVNAIYTYLASGTLIEDLDREIKSKKSGVKKYDEKDGARFVVQLPIDSDKVDEEKTWEDREIRKVWQDYYLETINKGEKALDFISGNLLTYTEKHPKVLGNSRLISSNKGEQKLAYITDRFANAKHAFSVGYESSQMAHQFLRYLLTDEGRIYQCGKQVIFSFTVGAKEKPLPVLDETKSIYDMAIELNKTLISTTNDKLQSIQAETGFNYSEALKMALSGLKYSKTLNEGAHTKTAIVALDVTTETSGRLSVTFYRELDRDEYLEKIAEWHEDCKWNHVFWREDGGKKIPVSYIGAPSVDRIIEAVYGKPRSRKDEGYTKIKKAARERLLRCIFDGASLPLDYVTSAVRRASNPLAVTTKNGGFDRNAFAQLQATACALVRKDFKQRKEEDYALSLQSERTDRDYLYGRLLGAADKLEEYALHKKDNDRMVTAAIRYMQTFAQRPFRTWQTIHACLTPYIQTVKGSFAFTEIQSVMELFKPGDYENDTPLNGSYLIGYYHERAHIDNLVAQAKANAKKTSTPDNQTEEYHE